MTLLTTDLGAADNIPYFMWDDAMTVAEILEKLRNGSRPEQIRLVAKILREARDSDVWRFLRPSDVVKMWDDVAPFLGRRRAFWEYILARWKTEGLLDSK